MRREFSVCLSHDVDRVKKTFQFATHFSRSIVKRDLRSAVYQMRSIFLRSHYWSFEKLMDAEKKRGLRSTFFFLDESYPVNFFKPTSWRLGLGYYNMSALRVKEIIRALDAQGWEIGLHGSYRSYKDSDLLKREKNILEAILGHPVMGIRQHYLNLDESTWSKQYKLGFFYDASYGYTNDIGFKERRYHPFTPISNRRFLVVPLALMDSCVMKRRNPLREAMEVIDLAAEKKACLVINWHQRVFNEKEFPGYADVYWAVIDECFRKKAKFFTIGEYVNTHGYEAFSE